MKDKFSKLKQIQVFESAEKGSPFAASALPGKFISLRKALGLTQRQMAKRLGMSQPAYLNIEKRLDFSGLKTIEKFLKELNCELALRIKPHEPFSRLIKKRAVIKAKALLDRTYSNMALEQQSPDKKAFEKRLKELTEELAENPDSSLWED